MSNTAEEKSIEQIPPQELTKYNRESGNKTRYFVGALLIVIVVLSCLVIYLAL